MAASSTRSVSLAFTGDVSVGTQNFPAAANGASPAAIQPVALSTGNNTVPVPAGAVAVTVTKPAGNAVLVKLKGDNADVGIALHHTDPDSVSIDATQTSIILNAASSVTVRLLWT